MTEKEETDFKPSSADPDAYIRTLNRKQRRTRKKFLKKMGWDPNTFKGKLIVGKQVF